VSVGLDDRTSRRDVVGRRASATGHAPTKLPKVALAVVAIAITLGVLEVLLARFQPQRTRGHVERNHAAMYRRGDAFPFELIPGFSGREREHEGEFDVAIDINSLGYRQPEFSPERSTDVRMVAIGDSFTFGDGVEAEEAWPLAVERAFAARSGASTQVINAGVPGRWMDEYYLELARRSLALDPDVVLLGFFVGNDVDGTDARAHVWTRVDSRGLPLAIDVPGLRVENGLRVKSKPKSRWRIPIVRDSHVAQLFFDGGRAVAQAWHPSPLAEDIVYTPEDTPETKAVVERVERLLLAIVERSRENRAHLLVVMIPTREQIHPDLAPDDRPRDWEKPQRHFRAFLQRSGIPFVDLFPLLAAERDTAPLYYRFDAHWTPRGHALAAEAIAAALDDVPTRDRARSEAPSS
jgi:lysophospholipase L1-like esterase